MSEVLDKLLEMSHYREDRLVMPLVIEFFTLTRKYGFEPEDVLENMQKYYESRKPQKPK